MNVLAPPLAAVALLAAAPAPTSVPDRSASQYVVARWGTDSLGSNTVHALAQGSDGAIWIGTGSGLVRHDGTRFTALDPSAPSAQALAGGVSSLARDDAGALYAGTTAGSVLRYARGVFTLLPLQEPTGPVYALFAAPGTADAAVWVGQHGRPIARWSAAGGTQYFVDDVTTVTPQAVARDTGGRLWVGSNDGLHVLDGPRFRRSDITSDAVRALACGADGALWIGTRHGLLRYERGVATRYTTNDGLPADRIAALVVDRRSHVWIGTRAGLTRGSAAAFSTLTARDGLPDDDVHALLEDRDGNLWVGTGDGLARLSEGRFTAYGRQEGLPDPAIASVIAARGGGIWMGSASGDVLRLEPDGRLRTFALSGGGPGSEAVIALHEARDGAVWAALANGRVFRLDRGVAREQTPEVDVHERQRVAAFFEDDVGVGVAVMRVGLARLRGRQLVPVYSEVGTINYPHAIHRDRRGALWVGASYGLARIDAAGVTIHRTEQGLPHNRVRWISEDEDGALWLATGAGLARLANGVFQKLALPEGLPENHLRVVLDDGLGHLWIAGLGTLFRLDKAEARDVLDQRRARVSPLLFDASDGLRTTEALTSNAPAARASDGRLWFATTKGVAVVDPRTISADGPAPAATIESVTVDRRPGETRTAATYGPGRGEVTIDYGAIHFVSPHRIRFRHRLVGLDADWVDVGSRRQAHYAALPAGSYRFEVVASNADGRWNGTPASLELALRPPFHHTWPFFGLCAGVVAALAAAVHRLRIGQVRARLASVIHERTRIARELHDTLAQGVAGIGLQIETGLRTLDGDPEQARMDLRRAHAMARSSLNEVRRSIWVLRAQTHGDDEGLDVTLSRSLRRLTDESGLVATFELSGPPRRLAAAVERSLLRIAHEAMTNVVRHSQAQHVTVRLEFAADSFVLVVRDDGCGFDFEAHLARSGREHFGLLGIVERARILGGELRVASAPDAGAEVFCRIPYDARVASEESEDDVERGS